MKPKKINHEVKISIIIPSFNKVRFIQETLQSIINQKYPNLEVLIYDGGSSDGTLEIIEKYCKKYPNIFKLVSKKDKGQLDAINRGLIKSKGEILTFINADDVYKPGALWKVAGVFKNNPNPFWCTGFGNIINESGFVINPLVTKYKNLLKKINKYSFLLAVNYLTQPSTFISKQAYHKFGPFTGTKKYIMEYEMWLKLGKKQMPIVIPELLTSFRLASDNISITSYDTLLDLDTKIAKKFTKNQVLILLHKLHNDGRKIIVSK